MVKVLVSAFISYWVGLAAYGGYLGMWDWTVLWPGFTIIMKYLGYIGIGIVALILIAIPQIQYLKNKDTYFLITDDYEAYKEKMKSKVN